MTDSGHTTPRGGRKDLFGLRLEDAITKEAEVIGAEIPNHEIPVVLELLALHIETRGIDADQLLMASETTKEVADLRKQLSMGDLKIPQSEDVQTIAGAFKLYLKLLPEPILPSTTFKPLCQLIKKKFKGYDDKGEGRETIKKLMDGLPKIHLDAAKRVFQCLKGVADDWFTSEDMSGKILQSIGYCIFRPDNAVNKIKTKDLTKGSKVLRLLLYYFDDLFGPPAKNILERKSIIHSRSANDLLRMKRMSMQSSNSISALHSANQSESSETKPKKDTAKANVDGEKERIDGSAATKAKRQPTSSSDESS
jgi:hypothetical protein